MKGKDTDDSVMGNFSNIRRIRRLTGQEELLMMREVTCEDKNHQKTNILYFFIKTNVIEESKVKVLIDSGSDLNFIHPEVVKKLGIKTEGSTSLLEFQDLDMESLMSLKKLKNVFYVIRITLKLFNFMFSESQM